MFDDDATQPLTAARPLDIAVIAGVRFDTSEPHAGGLERHTDVLATALQRRGHSVTVFAGAGAPTKTPGRRYVVEPLVDEPIALSDAARADVSMPPDRFMIEHDAYLDLSDRLRERTFDVVHNNSLHYLPVLSDDRHPIVHTLHTPPTPWLESAHRIGRRRRRRHSRTVSVSNDNAARWNGIVDRVIHNGIDVDSWQTGDGGGGYAFWSGRLVPEKGAHLAIEAARRAGVKLIVAGPAHDRAYFDESIAPALGPDCEYVGHCVSADVARYLASADVAVVSPCWDEPFGLVVAEALASGTPVAAFRRGAIPELLDDEIGVIADAGDVDALADAILAASHLDRDACRRAARQRFAATAMAERYECVYRELLAS
ncbi:MAG: glycosyltransferase [Ilumatobacteraceae bacterium]